MTPPLQMPVLAPDAFDKALQSARGAAASNGAVWLALLEALGVSESKLAAVLLDWHGIAVIEDHQWPAARLVGTQGGLVFALDGRNYLLSEDPWSPESLQALSRSGHGQMQLALARPGQVAPQGELSAPPVRRDGVSEPDADASPVVHFVDAAIGRAYGEGASDVHFETDRKGVGIKYRLDGVMAGGERLDDPQRAEEVISRIKVMAQLDITERRRPQDGRIHWRRGEGDAVDLRVSIMPSIFGEDAVLRLLDKAQLRHAQQSVSLNALGFEGEVAATLRSLASRPHGMLLITGPTGSGKTTTVYAALSEVNDGLEKIVTIEDPVEYELPGVLQIPVNEQKGLTFATGLRSILRHDPDKILVGEIRDAETAEIAVQSSLTGHLVFTTVHANSLFDVLGRFQHFGIDPFALASALNGVVVQRLLRRLCPHCAAWRAPAAAEAQKLAALKLTVPERLPVACGCENCRQTGYRGRFVVAEIHALSDTVRDLILRRTSMLELKETVYKDADSRLLAQAMAKVAQGLTTQEEVARVVGLV